MSWVLSSQTWFLSGYTDSLVPRGTPTANEIQDNRNPSSGSARMCVSKTAQQPAPVRQAHPRTGYKRRKSGMQFALLTDITMQILSKPNRHWRGCLQAPQQRPDVQFMSTRSILCESANASRSGDRSLVHRPRIVCARPKAAVGTGGVSLRLWHALRHAAKEDHREKQQAWKTAKCSSAVETMETFRPCKQHPFPRHSKACSAVCHWQGVRRDHFQNSMGDD